MLKKTFLLALGLCAFALQAHANDRIVTASERGTYIEIGRDLSRLVAKPVGLTLDVLPSKGSAENVRRLRVEPNVRLALVQNDVYRAFTDQARAGDAEAARLISPLRVVMPLYNEEIYFVTRADSPLKYIHEIRGKRINIGLVGSGTALTATTVYRAMFGTALSEQNTSTLSNEDALVKLASEKSIDVVVVIAGQPAKLFADMKQEARQYIKLLAVDPQAPETKAASETYADTTIRSSSYPNWLTQDVSALAVKSMLVTYDFPAGSEAQDHLVRIAKSMCVNFDRLKTEGHAKWQEVSQTLPPLSTGWSYYAPTHRILSNCAAQQISNDNRPGRDQACTQSRELLGLCRR